MQLLSFVGAEASMTAEHHVLASVRQSMNVVRSFSCSAILPTPPRDAWLLASTRVDVYHPPAEMIRVQVVCSMLVKVSFHAIRSPYRISTLSTSVFTIVRPSPAIDRYDSGRKYA